MAITEQSARTAFLFLHLSNASGLPKIIGSPHATYSRENERDNKQGTEIELVYNLFSSSTPFYLLRPLQLILYPYPIVSFRSREKFIFILKTTLIPRYFIYGAIISVILRLVRSRSQFFQRRMLEIPRQANRNSTETRPNFRDNCTLCDNRAVSIYFPVDSPKPKATSRPAGSEYRKRRSRLIFFARRELCLFDVCGAPNFTVLLFYKEQVARSSKMFD